jgi:hypothetical protein
MRAVDDNSNACVAPIIDLSFKTFPFLRFLPFTFARKPYLAKCSMDEMMKAIKKITVSLDENPHTATEIYTLAYLYRKTHFIQSSKFPPNINVSI